MKDEREYFVLIVAKLAAGYTSKESTSISYDKAQQLMEAALYSIHEVEKTECFYPATKEKLSVVKMYEIGAKRVVEKTKEALKIYNELMTCFEYYGNICLYDTVAKGMQEFFKWYDCKYAPQDTILTLDYPILIDLSECTGIDKIYEYLLCIRLEQKFLQQFSTEYVVEVLENYSKQYKTMIDNLREIVLCHVITHMAEREQLCVTNKEEMIRVVDTLVQKYYENDERLREYLYMAANNIWVRMQTAAEQ